MAQAQEQERESWKSNIPGRIYLKQINSQGHVHDVVVHPGKAVHLTPQERHMNQEMAASKDQDVFANGFMSPIRLIENSEEAAAIAANPNLMTESDMRALFKNTRGFNARLTEISNVLTLQRMIELADEVDASLRQVSAIQARIVELTPDSSNAEIAVERRPVVGASTRGGVTPR
jgi:hypothetical protein